MGYRENNLLARLDYELADNSRIYTWLNRSGIEMDWFGEDEDGYLVTSASGWDQSLTSNLKLHSRFAYSVWDLDVANEHHELVQPEAWLDWDAGADHFVTAGVDFKHRDFERNSVENAPSQKTYGSFVKDSWLLSDQLTLSSALRYDDVEDVESELSPKLSMLYSPDMPARFRASVSRGFHAPTPQELYEVAAGHGGPHLRFGNQDLKPENSTTYSLGVEIFPGQRFEVMLYSYYSQIDDMIVPLFEGAWSKNPEKNVWRRHNVDTVDLYGGEIEGRYIFSRNFRLEAGYSYSGQEGTENGKELPYDPGTSAYIKGVASRKVSGDMSGSAFVGLKGEFDRSAWSWKPAEGDPSTNLDDYQNLTAGLSLNYKESQDIYVKGYNLLGQTIEALDDVLTRYEDDPVFEVGMTRYW